jgi:hypothetical protein
MGLPDTAKTMTFILTRDRPKAIAFYQDVLAETCRILRNPRGL